MTHSYPFRIFSPLPSRSRRTCAGSCCGELFQMIVFAGPAWGAGDEVGKVRDEGSGDGKNDPRFEAGNCP